MQQRARQWQQHWLETRESGCTASRAGACAVVSGSGTGREAEGAVGLRRLRVAAADEGSPRGTGTAAKAKAEPAVGEANLYIHGDGPHLDSNGGVPSRYVRPSMIHRLAQLSAALVKCRPAGRDRARWPCSDASHSKPGPQTAPSEHAAHLR